MGAVVDQIGKPIQLVYFPPYHSKYNPIERCWGILEQHWNGTQLITVETMLAWAQSMTWKGLHPRSPSDARPIRKGVTGQGGDACSGGALGTSSAFTEMGHYDSPGCPNVIWYLFCEITLEEEQGVLWVGEARATLPASAAPAAPTALAPRTYTPAYLAEQILTSRSALEGERKQVTVLFADLKGSMELLAERDPEEARQLLDPVLEYMMAAVHRYEGTVNQVMGDGIMALFGAPLAHEDHAVRACYAALAMQEALQRYAEEIRRTQGLLVQMRVGLNSGEVVVRAIGNDLHMDYSAIGQTTHLAARMEQLAAPGSILLTAATLRLVEGVSAGTGARPGAGQRPGGAGGGVRAGRRHSPAAALTGGSGPGAVALVGRQSEVEALQQALTRARTGQGQVVALLGEPGVGNRAWSTSFSSRTTRRAGCGWRAAPCPTARPPPTCRSAICLKRTVISRIAMISGQSGLRSPGSS